MQQKKIELATRKNWTQQILKKKREIRWELLEFCKTRTKKSSRDRLNFYLVPAAPDMVTDNDSCTTCWSKFKAPSLKTNTKKQRPSENIGFI